MATESHFKRNGKSGQEHSPKHAGVTSTWVSGWVSSWRDVEDVVNIEDDRRDVGSATVRGPPNGCVQQLRRTARRPLGKRYNDRREQDGLRHQTDGQRGSLASQPHHAKEGVGEQLRPQNKEPNANGGQDQTAVDESA